MWDFDTQAKKVIYPCFRLCLQHCKSINSIYIECILIPKQSGCLRVQSQYLFAWSGMLLSASHPNLMIHCLPPKCSSRSQDNKCGLGQLLFFSLPPPLYCCCQSWPNFLSPRVFKKIIWFIWKLQVLPVLLF